eukprot:2667888-Amphidinium_carterae.1
MASKLAQLMTGMAYGNTVAGHDVPRATLHRRVRTDEESVMTTTFEWKEYKETLPQVMSMQ